MIRAKKVRLYPTQEQEQKLWQSAGTARYIYNWTLNEQQENFKAGGKFILDGELRKQITQLKKNELSWLSEVSNNVAKQAVKDACGAYKKFFNKQKQKGYQKFTKKVLKKCERQNRKPTLYEMNGFPKFKSRKKSKPSFYNDTAKLKVDKDKVLLEKIGWVKIKPHQLPIVSKYTNPRISFDGKYWYISVGIDQEPPVVELTDEVIGIDVGVKVLAFCSNEKSYKNINKTRVVRYYEKKLRRLQRKVSRKYENNKKGKEYVKNSNIIKLEKQIRLLYRKLKNIRFNHLHQTTNEIVKTKPSKVVMETLNIKSMMKNKYLAKSIAQQCLYEFKRQLQYKCEWYGIEFVEADRWYASSKTCSRCGHKKAKLSLSERVYKCECCGLRIDRDYNASVNLSRYELA